MEIDLNHALNEIVDKNNGEIDFSCSTYLELWHACAGPITCSLPKKGNLVVYFPRGHLEQQIDFSHVQVQVPYFDLPPQIFCRVLNVQLLANKENDEVYTQLTLLPQAELGEPNSKDENDLGQDEDVAGGSSPKSTHMFCKTLTASDTSTHEGFSVLVELLRTVFLLWTTSSKGHHRSLLQRIFME